MADMTREEGIRAKVEGTDFRRRDGSELAKEEELLWDEVQKDLLYLLDENARLRAELEAAQRDLALIPTICYGNCSGDPAVGVPDCPFFDWVEDDKIGYREAARRCRYMTPDTAPNISPRCAVPTDGTESPFDEPSGPCAENGGTK